MKNLALNILLLPVILLGSFCISAVTFVDPTHPANYVPSNNDTNSSSNKTLSMIFVSPTRREAIINGGVFHEGDKFGQFTITVITPYSVEMIGPQNTKEVLFLATDVKKRHE